MRQVSQYMCLISMYMPHINVYVSYQLTAINNVTRNTGNIHFTLMLCSPEQICLPYLSKMSHCTITVVYIQTTSVQSYPQNKKKASFIYQTIAIYISQHTCCSIATHMPDMQISSNEDVSLFVNIYVPYELSAINNVTMHTGKQKLHITGILS